MKKRYLATLLAAGSLVAAAQVAWADVVLEQSTDADAMVDALLDPVGELEVVSGSASYTGVEDQSGFFSNADFLGENFTEGVVLTTGNIFNLIPGPNTGVTSDTLNTPGDADLADLIGVSEGDTQDAAILEFSFIPQTDTISFRFVFASEEYNDFVGSEFNDVFGFFLNGENIALIPGTDTPIAINTVHGGNPNEDPPIPPSHEEFFTDNTLEAGAPLNTGLNGLVGQSQPLFATGTVTPGVENHIKLAIADVSDGAWDSAVFLQGGAFTATPPPPPPVDECPPGMHMHEGVCVIPLPAAAWMGIGMLGVLGVVGKVRRRLQLI